MSNKSVKQACQVRESSKSVLQECHTRVSNKSVKQECLTRALRNSVKQGCPTRVSPQRVNSGCLTSGFAGKCEISVPQYTCRHSGSWVSSCLIVCFFQGWLFQRKAITGIHWKSHHRKIFFPTDCSKIFSMVFQISIFDGRWCLKNAKLSIFFPSTSSKDDYCIENILSGSRIVSMYMFIDDYIWSRPDQSCGLPQESPKTGRHCRIPTEADWWFLDVLVTCFFLSFWARSNQLDHPVFQVHLKRLGCWKRSLMSSGCELTVQSLNHFEELDIFLGSVLNSWFLSWQHWQLE